MEISKFYLLIRKESINDKQNIRNSLTFFINVYAKTKGKKTYNNLKLSNNFLIQFLNLYRFYSFETLIFVLLSSCSSIQIV